MSDWFEEWFGEEYLTLYPHRDDQEACRAIDLIARRALLTPRARVLDLACGAGRHLRLLDDHYEAVGLDLSPALLRGARVQDAAARLVRGDMRSLPFGTATFDLVANLFTSFGYFRDDSQHERVMREVGRVVRPGGWFILDFLNASQVRATLVAVNRISAGSREIELEREISADGRFVRKTITLLDEDRSFVERVRLFEPSELQAMFERASFEVDEIVGDYDGTPWTNESPRAIVIGRRA